MDQVDRVRAQQQNYLQKKFSFSVLYSGLVYRYAAKKLLENRPKNKIKYLNSLVKRINYNKIKKLNLHTPQISSYSAVIAKEKNKKNYYQ